MKTEEPKVKCPECGGSGLKLIRMPVQEYIQRNGLVNIYGKENWDMDVGIKCPLCNGGMDIRVQQAKSSANIPETFYDKRLTDFDWNYVDDSGNAVDLTKHKGVVESFVKDYEKWDDKGLGLYIYSECKGSGKTFLASCICNELMATKAMRTRFVNASDLIKISQSGEYWSNDMYKKDPLLLLYNCKFLVIDDLGQKNCGGEWIEDLLYTLLNDRINNKKVTVITSNVKINQLPFDERITDRINSMCVPLHLPEVRRRGKDAQRVKHDFMKEIGLVI